MLCCRQEDGDWSRARSGALLPGPVHSVRSLFSVSQQTKAFWGKPKVFGCYMVKPHGPLVRVSFTHYCASTSRLSTL